MAGFGDCRTGDPGPDTPARERKRPRAGRVFPHRSQGDIPIVMAGGAGRRIEGGRLETPAGVPRDPLRRKSDAHEVPSLDRSRPGSRACDDSWGTRRSLRSTSRFARCSEADLRQVREPEHDRERQRPDGALHSSRRPTNEVRHRTRCSLIVEATSGNTGISFSAIGRALGHPVAIFMPDWMSPERVNLIRAFGAERPLL